MDRQGKLVIGKEVCSSTPLTQPPLSVLNWQMTEGDMFWRALRGMGFLQWLWMFSGLGSGKLDAHSRKLLCFLN